MIMFNSREKRGLSDVVTVSLIILLAIAAVVIVWSFVKPTIENTGKQISESNCLGVNIRPISCNLTSNSVIVDNGVGDSKIDGIRLVYYKTIASDSESEVVTDATGCDNLRPLERKTCSVSDEPFGGAPAQVSVAAILGEKSCPASTQRIGCSK